MIITCEVTLGRQIHRIRVEVPAGHGRKELESLEQFAVATAWLERCGYLPQGVTNAVDWSPDKRNP